MVYSITYRLNWHKRVTKFLRAYLKCNVQLVKGKKIPLNWSILNIITGLYLSPRCKSPRCTSFDGTFLDCLRFVHMTVTKLVWELLKRNSFHTLYGTFLYSTGSTGDWTLLTQRLHFSFVVNFEIFKNDTYEYYQSTLKFVFVSPPKILSK